VLHLVRVAHEVEQLGPVVVVLVFDQLGRVGAEGEQSRHRKAALEEVFVEASFG